MFFITEWDVCILNWIKEHLSCAWLDAVFPVYSALGNGGHIWLGAAVVLLCTKKYCKTGLAMAISLLLCMLICNLTLKPLFARVRPFDAEGVVPLVFPPKDGSFPSGHTASSFAAATAVFIYHKKAGAWLLGAAALMGFSRLYLYVHYPTDVLAGAVLGILLGMLGVLLTRLPDRIRKRHRLFQ